MLVLNLGRQSYAQAWELQHRLVRARQEGRLDDILLLLEHDPVITLGRSATSEHILASSELLSKAGINVFRVERGGGVTYHGPGQLVGYPILSLARFRLGVSDYMHTLEQVILDVLTDFGVPAYRNPATIGVWVGNGRKIASLGARIEKGVTYHGFALNVAPDLSHFQLIVPCGQAEADMTSMERELSIPVSMASVREQVIIRFQQVFSVSLQPVDLADLPIN